MSTGLFIFRRDLRIQDNRALNALADRVDSIVPVFIFDPRQIGPHPYRSEFGLRFLLDSLHDLKQQVPQLCFLYGDPETVLTRLLETLSIDAVGFNLDYTPFARARDAALDRILKSHGKPLVAAHDALLLRPGQIATGAGNPFTVFTPFYKRGMKEPIDEPYTAPQIRFLSAQEMIPAELCCSLASISCSVASQIRGGTSAANAILQNISGYRDYQDQRDLLAEHGTTHLSAHLKFGTVSVRQVRTAVRSVFSDEHPLIRQLFWRDFYVHVSIAFPHVYGDAFNRKFSGVLWDDAPEKFERWCAGTTGVPVVDAGMRELRQTGFMHNRARMITAAFLVKDLHIDWRLGERYFATQLVDYDPAVNNGNWQWAASTGCDAAPYFRIFNPWLQGLRFDPDGVYIKRWVPELAACATADLHDPTASRGTAYPRPMVDHKQEAEEAKRRYKVLA